MSSEFSLAGLNFNLGEYQNAIDDAIKRAEKDHLVKRLWARDHTLWKSHPDEISNRLGWLDISARIKVEISSLVEFAKSVKEDGIDRVLLLGMGGSSLAPELLSKIFGNEDGLRLSVLDSTDPDAVSEKEIEHDPEWTLFIVSSKSGGTVETSSFFKYFYNKTLKKLGTPEASKHFLAITDPGSGLAGIGANLNFRHVFLADPNIGGRYSALSHFGLVPAALIGLDLERLLASADEMAERCKENDVSMNPGAMLGLILGNLALTGRDKPTFVFPERETFADWVEQLIAESTGKEGKGILPIVREPVLRHEDYGNDRVFVCLQDAGKTPQIHLQWQDDYDVGGLFIVWEFAIAVAGYVLRINPFDQPNVESAKVQARDLVADYQKTKRLPSDHLNELSWATLQAFARQAKQGDYVALQAYANPSKELKLAIEKLRSILTRQTGAATTFGYGPRFLHSTGQLHKGGAGNGLFVQFITKPSSDLPIPNEAGDDRSDLDFGILKLAQALGDAQALRNAGRRVLSFEISGDLVAAIHILIKEAGLHG